MAVRALPVLLREADPSEAGAVLDFYTALNDPNLLDRDLVELRGAADNGLLFVVLDGPDLVAAAGVFDIADDHVEFGATGVSVPYRGHKLQQLLARTRAAATVAHHGRFDVHTTAIKPSNHPSRKNMTDVGFTPWHTPIAAMTSVCAPSGTRPGCAQYQGLVGRPCCCDFYILEPHRKHRCIAQFLADVPAPGSVVALFNKYGTSRLDVQMETIVAGGPHRLDLGSLRSAIGVVS